MLSVATDYADSLDDPQPHLRRIAAAGFTHTHWCHQWNTDYLYSDDDTGLIRRCMSDCGLALTDLHASQGPTAHWLSDEPGRCERGLSLGRNRIEMTHRLGGDVAVFHVPREPDDVARRDPWWDVLRSGMDHLTAFAAPLGVRIALENLAPDNFGVLGRLFALYGEQAVGLCYDSGHGQLLPNGLDRLEALTDRLISMHLHDNDATRDQHRLPFTGKVDWPRLTALIARSPYAKPLSLEVSMDPAQWPTAEAFLAEAHRVGERLTVMVQQARNASAR